MTSELLTFTEYAARKGWTQPYVSQLVKAGRIPLAPGAQKRIDPEAADAALAATADPSRLATVARHAQDRARKGGASSVDMGPVTGGEYHLAKTESERFRAKTAEMEYRKAMGELVERTAYDAGLIEALGPIVSRLDSMVVRMSPKLINQSEVGAIAAVLSAEVTAIRQEIADAIRALIPGATRQ